jgi:hypothetical protein
LGEGNEPLVLRRFISVFELEIPGQTAAESACLAKPISQYSIIRDNKKIDSSGV